MELFWVMLLNVVPMCAVCCFFIWLIVREQLRWRRFKRQWWFAQRALRSGLVLDSSHWWRQIGEAENGLPYMALARMRRQMLKELGPEPEHGGR